MKKSLDLSAVIILLILAIGCSPKGEDFTTLRVVSTTIIEKPEGEVEQNIADLFQEKNPNVKIEFDGVKMNEFYAELAALASSRQLPDIFANNPEFMVAPYEMGVTEDLNNIFDKSYIDKFDEQAIEYSTYEGSLLMMPHFVVPTGLFYRADWLAETGLNPPETWEDFIKVAQAMTKDTDGDGVIDRYGFAMVGTNNGSGHFRFVEFLRSFGVAELTRQGNEWVTTLDSPQTIKAFEMFADFKNKFGIVGPGALETGYGEAITLIATGKAGMMITGPHSIGAILAQNPALAGKLGSVPVPKDTNHSSAYGMGGFSISSDSKNKDLAAEYIKYLLNEENQVEWTRRTGRLPTLRAAMESDVVSGEVFGGFIEALKYTHETPAVAYYNEARSLLGDAYQTLMLSPETDTKELIDVIIKKTNDLILENR